MPSWPSSIVVRKIKNIIIILISQNYLTVELHLLRVCHTCTSMLGVDCLFDLFDDLFGKECY
jgi:hypothetical protein